MSGQSFPLPPASLEFLIFSLRAEAEIRLEEPAFELARHSIDMLAILQEKTKGNLTREESRLLENTLTELRMRFVQAK
jgi:Domain of unknown function (DUF1844)